ncbi:MAG: serine/threonine-protein kinase, partial [Catenulispora sp.]
MSVNVEPLRSGDPKGVGRYRFLGRLGAGGMGLVCLGRGPDGRLVAVKLIHEDIAADPDYRRRFAREVRAAAAVQARFTAALVDADPQAEQPWYASEFIDGPTVGQIVRRTGPLGERALRALAAGLAEAVAAFETAGLVHRDLKPDNILMAADGPKVIDFGIARGENDSLLTRAGSVLGSPGYMSPEQIAGDRVHTASDVFSLGAVIAFAGQATGPFGDGPAEARMYMTKFGEPDLSGMPMPMRAPVLQCLAKKPRDRPTPQQLVTWWSVRPDELDTLIEVGRGPGAHSAESARPTGERLYGAGGGGGGASSGNSGAGR